MKLADALATLRQGVAALSPPQTGARDGRPLLAHVDDRLHRRFADILPRPPGPLDLDEAEAAFRAALAGGDWSALSARHWRQAPWLLWRGEPWLAGEAEFLRRLEGRSRGRARAVKRLIEVYLREFQPEREGMAALAGLLARLLADPALPATLREWRDRHARYALFDPAVAPAALARLVLAAEPGQAPLRRLAEAGLAGALALGGLGRAAYRAALEEAAGETAVAALLRWSAGRHGLFYPAERPRLAAALLDPWRRRPPPPALRERVQPFLLRHYGDPRREPERWRGVAEAQVAVLLGWLADQTLERFFQLLDRMAAEGVDTAPDWVWRRRFWEAYRRRGAVQGVWLALGPRAREVAARAGGPPLLTGRLQGFAPGHSILLLQLEGLIVAEQNPLGRCYLWRPDNPHAPRLYRDDYDAAEWRRACAHAEPLRPGEREPGISHFDGERGAWQAVVERYLRGYCGIAVGREEYLN